MNDFLKNINNEELLQTSSQYFPRKTYTDDSEKTINIAISLSKGLIREYNEWLTENFDIKPKN